MILASRRIVLEPSPAAVARPGELEACFVGHAPGLAKPERLAKGSGELAGVRDNLHSLGFYRVLAAIDRYAAEGEVPSDPLALRRVTRLFDLPLAIGSPAELSRLFPEAGTAACRRSSVLAGSRAWLMTAVEDFFHAGGRRAWVVVVPEEEGQSAFLPRPRRNLSGDVEELQGTELTALCPNVALLAVPDLERLQIPARLTVIGDLQPPPPEPRFLPCDGGEAARVSEPVPPPPQDSALPHSIVLNQLAGFLASLRPDVQLLIAPPPETDERQMQIVADLAALAALRGLEQQQATAAARVQPLWPYLSSGRARLSSPSGAVAGAIALSARERGAWRSIAGRPLRADAVPYPRVDALAAARLREAHGLGVLLLVDGRLELDDERCLSAEWANSAEIVRFVGDLRRHLQRLGERWVFVVDPREPGPELALARFFTGLHQAGALRGSTADAAFDLRRRELSESVVAYDIALAPAYPIDKIVLSFVHTRERSAVEVSRA